MHAKETKLQEILEGTKQYVIPLFQRSYSWTSKEWGILWKDITELAELDNPRVFQKKSCMKLQVLKKI